MLQKLHNPKKDSVASVDPVVFVNPVTGCLETITPTSEQKIDDRDVEYEVLMNPVSRHLEKILSPKKKKDSVKVKIKA